MKKQGQVTHTQIVRLARRSAPHEVDSHVGVRIKNRRRELRLSQDAVSEALGITFQQVQKYEKGENRVSASRLLAIAQVLRTSVSYFYEGLSEDDDAEIDSAVAVYDAFTASSEGREVCELMLKVGSGRVRRNLVNLIRALAEAEPQG